MNTRRAVLLSLTFVTATLMTTVVAHASIIWNWSFPGYAGTFTTDGDLPAATTTYNITNFELTTTGDAANFPLGSISAGEYAEAFNFGSDPSVPATFAWDQSSMQPTGWGTRSGLHAVIENTADTNFGFFFGVNASGSFDITQASAQDFPGATGTGGSVTLAPAAPPSTVPEPSTFAMAALGLLPLGMIGRRRRRR